MRTPIEFLPTLALTVASTIVLGSFPALAAPINYDFAPSFITADAEAPASGSDLISGNFTFDPSGPTLDSVDIALAGPFDAGAYTVVSGATADSISASVSGDPDEILTLTFADPLGSTGDEVTGLVTTLSDPNIPTIDFTIEAGFAEPLLPPPASTPEPGSLALFGGSALGLLLFARRTKARRR